MVRIWLAIFVLSITTNASAAGSLNAITLTANTTLNGVCPLTEPVECICNGTNTIALTWKLNSVLIRTIASTHRPSELEATQHGGILVQIISVVATRGDRANISTRIIVEPSVLTFGDQILCNNATTNATLIYMKKAAPPAVPVVTNLSKETGNSVKLTLQWTTSFTEAHSVDEYCVIAPAGSVCQSETTCLTPDTDYECSGLVAGNQYGFVVYARNCGNQLGATSTSIITPRVPHHPATCVSVPVYDQSTQRLVAIQNNWTAAPNPVEIAHGVQQNVLWYNIAFERDNTSNGSKTISVADSCTGQKCRSVISTSFFGSHYTVFVAAENIAGLGEHLTCTPVQISTSNSMVQVTANTSEPEHATVECLLLAQLPASCQVCYGVSMMEQCASLSCLTTVDSDDNGRAVVTLPSLERKLKYCYTATIIVDSVEVLVVEGTFSTECDKKDLVCHVNTNLAGSTNTDSILDTRCSPDSVDSLSIPNGVACYNGTTLGSTANYICDDGFEVPADNSQRVCQTDGHWDGDVPECSQILGNEKGKTQTIMTILGLMLALTIGVLIASLIYICVLKCAEKHNAKHTYVNHSVSHTARSHTVNISSTVSHTVDNTTKHNGSKSATSTRQPPTSSYTLVGLPEYATNEAKKMEVEYEEIPDYFKSLTQDKQNNYQPYSRVGRK